jgi:hypothetical protein
MAKKASNHNGRNKITKQACAASFRKEVIAASMLIHRNGTFNPTASKRKLIKNA